MYPEAVEYLKPVQYTARLFGLLPYLFSADLVLSKFHVIYTLVLIPLAVNSYTVVAISDFYYHRDIVCFTCLLAHAATFTFHMSAILTPLLQRNTYSKLLVSVEYVEKLIHDLNITQSQSPTTFYVRTWIAYLVLVLMCHCYITFFLLESTLIVGVGFVACYMAYTICIFHLLSLLIVVKSKLVSINWHLDYLNNKFPVYLTPPDDRIFIEKKIRGKDVAGKFVDYGADVRRITEHKIIMFNRIHFLLYSSCNLIAKYFSLQIFLFVLTAILQAMKLFIMMFDQNVSLVSMKILFIIYVVNTFVHVFSVANAFHKIRHEVSELVPCPELGTVTYL